MATHRLLLGDTAAAARRLALGAHVLLPTQPAISVQVEALPRGGDSNERLFVEYPDGGRAIVAGDNGRRLSAIVNRSRMEGA